MISNEKGTHMQLVPRVLLVLLLALLLVLLLVLHVAGTAADAIAMRQEEEYSEGGKFKQHLIAELTA